MFGVNIIIYQRAYHLYYPTRDTNENDNKCFTWHDHQSDDNVVHTPVYSELLIVHKHRLH